VAYDIREFLTTEVIDRFPDFAREFVRTGNAVTAIQKSRVHNPMYRMSVWAERLLADPEIQRMIEVAETEAPKDRKKPKEYTRESLAEDFQNLYEMAVEQGDVSPAVTAKAKQAELLGLMEKNVRVTVSTSVAEMSMEELERELARLTDQGLVTLTAVEKDDGSVVYE
jgi:hypothetical protein